MYFPFDRPPDLVFGEVGLNDVPAIAFPAWATWKHATITFSDLSLDEFSILVDKIFRRLYSLPGNYIANTDVFDMR